MISIPSGFGKGLQLTMVKKVTKLKRKRPLDVMMSRNLADGNGKVAFITIVLYLYLRLLIVVSYLQ